MDRLEAGRLLAAFIEDLQKRPYSELRQFLSNPTCVEVSGSSGTRYQVEYEALWDSEPKGPLRIMVSIDDGGLISAMFPITESFLVDPDGKSS